jgi:hypothetical protein
MRREKYESQDDLDAEIRIINRIKAKWQCDAVKMPHEYYTDFFLVEEGGAKRALAKAMCEVRCRNHSFGDFDSVFISLNKARNLLEMAEFTGLPAFFVVQWDNMCGYIKLEPPLPNVSIGGRNNMRDKYDVEPVVNLPISGFKKLWDGKA